jgi:hypothetical protein
MLTLQVWRGRHRDWKECASAVRLRSNTVRRFNSPLSARDDEPSLARGPFNLTPADQIGYNSIFIRVRIGKLILAGALALFGVALTACSESADEINSALMSTSGLSTTEVSPSASTLATVSATLPTSRPSTAPTTMPSWRPPGVGTDGFDWIELKTGEWLKGHLKYVQRKRVGFDSEKLDRLTFNLKDVLCIYPANPMFVKFSDKEPVFGKVTVENDVVTVNGAHETQMPREELEGLTAGGERERDYWSGELALGSSFQTGNTHQETININASLARRTPRTRLELDYLSNFSKTNGTVDADNQRLGLAGDIFLNHGFFVRPLSLDYYRDPLSNIASRLNVGVSVGYDFFDREDLQWNVAAGPSYQKTWFENVPEGESNSAASPAGSLQTKFKAELTDRVDLILQYTGTFTTPESGSYISHAIGELKFELTKSFDLNVGVVWDHIQEPQAESGGVTPLKDDLRTTVSVGWIF